ncbi:hypothetical protein CMQ_2701 [Grosmannia clavigera kw1407]|uniref:Uncharacterized protein n=1 Tax=Grosmannia clavigera (strain kw1407 / UAMH 11150) TaxID=655863 RepID=F0XGG0_GROCL|nr:uncharacterized protein CMQ_2701 [Grosmannia clavigera kw1407]EFX02772.1 hypothetical protein CMQ_2701 [Grosmannia clavigera kw1407]
MVYKTPPSGGIVCLRCQLRLLHSPRPRRPSLFLTPHLLSRQTSRNGYAALARPQAWKARVIVASPRRLHHAASKDVDSKAAVQPKFSRDDETPVLLPDSSEPPAKSDEAAAKSDMEDIWDSLLADGIKATSDEVSSHIDALRPTDETTVTRSDFQRRRESLTAGFTVAQLREYIDAHREPVVRPAAYAWAVQQLPWVPGGPASELKAKTPSSALFLRGYTTSSMLSKDWLAVQLMRECWGLAVRELMDAPGLLDVTVRELEFALLAAGAQSWLRDISTAYSTVTTTTAATGRSRSRSHSRGQTRQHRHIELDPGQRLLRISAPAVTADAILADIDCMLARATTRAFRLADVADTRVVGALDAHMLRAVGAMTESWVRLSADEDEVLVSWIAQDHDHDHHLEDTGDRVHRFLLTAFGTSTLPQTTELDYEPLKRTKARLLAEFDSFSRDTWSWPYRHRNWARLVEPFLADASAARTRLPVQLPGAHSMPFEFVSPHTATATTDTGANAGADADAEDDHSQRWYRLIRTSTVATFGRVLHSPPSADKTSTLSDMASPATALQGLERILTPVYLDISDGRPVLAALHTVMAAHTSDVLFPTQPVDVRITQKRFFALPAADIAADPALDPLRAFLAQARLGQLGPSGQPLPLSTPARLSGLGLPARVLLPVGDGARLREQPRRRHQTIAVDYVFAGLEVRRRVATAFEGWTLALTSVDAGRGGGRHTALTLDATPAGTESGVSGVTLATGGDLSKTAFRHAVGRLVHSDTIHWLIPGRES